MKIYHFVLLIFFTKLVSPYMMGIDLGSEYFKVTVIKPGKPFMMMENLLSKTKTENALGLKDDEISYSYDALSKKAKTPSNVFNYLSEYLGREFNDSFITEYKNEFFQSYNISVEKDTNTISFQFKYNNKDEKLSIVEIYSMIFDYIKFLSEKFTNKEMTDAFITIPSFFDYQQRQAIADALKISKLRLAGMVSENLAAAVQFQLKKVFDKETFYIFYNMGSSYTQCSLVSFRTIFEKKNNKNVDIGNEIKVYGETYDEKLGGKYFDKNLYKLMINKFDNSKSRKGKKSVINNKKVYEKLRPWAIKYKEVLSANKETLMTVLGVEGNDDLNENIKREEFEEINKELISKAYSPIENLLNKANMKISDISQIELIGGSIRIPSIQEEIKKKLGNNSNILGIHMNGDDSMAFGAAYMCANSSKNFLGSRKTYMENGANEKFKYYLYNLENKSQPFNYYNEKDPEESNKNCVKRIKMEKELFPLRHRYNSQKTIEIEHDTNILLKITEEFPGKFGERDLKFFEITGVPEAIEQMKKDNVNSIPKININFIYTNGGQIELESYIKYNYTKYFSKDFVYDNKFTEPLPKEKIEKINKILKESVIISESEMKELIKNSTKEAEKENENEDKSRYKDESATSHYYKYNDIFYITTTAKRRLIKSKKIGKKKEGEIRIDLNIKETHLLSPKPMNEVQIQNSINKIKRLVEVDANRIKLNEKRNQLETLILDKKEYINEFSLEYFHPSEIANSMEFINNKSIWYEDEGFMAPYNVLEDEIKNIKDYFSKFDKRQKSYEERNIALNKFYKELNATQQTVIKTLKEKPWTRPYFEEIFLKEFNATIDWFKKAYDAQNKLKKWEPEILEPSQLSSRMENLKYYLNEMTMIEEEQESDNKLNDIKNDFDSDSENEEDYTNGLVLVNEKSSKESDL